jgi:glycosidase
MAEETPQHYRNLVLYEIYVRNHGPNGTFADVEADLPRIREMGVDVIWFMPIHPIGEEQRKGPLGSPYSIVDYRAVNPEYGTREDFKRLIERAHELDLRVMIDVVFNHTAHDSMMVARHPDWYHQDEAGRPFTTVPAWSDVIDLQHPNSELADYLIETLQGWVEFGVDGFRCDVASLVPLDFWLRAREAVAEVRPGVIWLAESVHAIFVAERREAGLTGVADAQLYRAFDMTYDYDIWPIWQAAVKQELPPSRYLEMVRFQDCIYPENYVKMRCVENHDQPRILAYAPTREQALAWAAFEAFNQGAFLIYAGQEAGADHTPSLFEIDKIEWGDYPLQSYYTKLARLKKAPALLEGQRMLLESAGTIQAAWEHPTESLYGIFNVTGERGAIDVQLPDGSYEELLGGEPVEVKDGRMRLPQVAAVLRYGAPVPLKEFKAPLLRH